MEGVRGRGEFVWRFCPARCGLIFFIFLYLSYRVHESSERALSDLDIYVS